MKKIVLTMLLLASSGAALAAPQIITGFDLLLSHLIERILDQSARVDSVKGIARTTGQHHLRSTIRSILGKK
jgi:hypothetical protein